MIEQRSESVRLAPKAGAWLCGEVWSAADPRAPVVWFIHGFGSTRGGEKARALQAACARRGWGFAAFDFRGHGESSGTILELRGSDLLDDLDTVAAHLAERGVQRLCLVGSSMGGWAAAWWTVRRPEAMTACVLLAPAFFFLSSRWSQLSEAERRAWQQTGRLRIKNEWVDTEIGYGLVEEMDRYSVERLAAAWSKPLLIFHGMRDTVVPFTHSVFFTAQAAGADVELRLLKNGDHRLSECKEQIADAACEFMARQMARQALTNG